MSNYEQKEGGAYWKSLSKKGINYYNGSLLTLCPHCNKLSEHKSGIFKNEKTKDTQPDLRLSVFHDTPPNAQNNVPTQQNQQTSNEGQHNTVSQQNVQNVKEAFNDPWVNDNGDVPF